MRTEAEILDHLRLCERVLKRQKATKDVLGEERTQAIINNLAWVLELPSNIHSGDVGRVG